VQLGVRGKCYERFRGSLLHANVVFNLQQQDLNGHLPGPDNWRHSWRYSDTVREKAGRGNRLDQRKLGLHS